MMDNEINKFDILNKKDVILNKYPQLSEKEIGDIYNLYTENLIPYVSTEYLSHIVASVRKWFRKLIDNDRFEIDVNPTPYKELDVKSIISLNNEKKKFKIDFYNANAPKEPIPVTDLMKRYKELTYMSIQYPGSLEKATTEISLNTLERKQILRIGIAHEISHAILVGLCIQNKVSEKTLSQIDKEIKKSQKQDKVNIRRSPTEETLVSLIAIIMLSEKCRFHTDEYPQYIYEDLETIVKMMFPT